ncbi:unnamed protein product [Psylliodes chrysocephalus]|uniref:Guanine nucleotide-binding protein subunit beta-like protein 1 n=1 Tax=Psylliodes chrysocephalus TaxID=3402493 RepID=A0A9P0CSP1_9CUCU|nr:unnamed protein product [Psylliodes chrysocephala]
MAILPPDPVFCFREDMGHVHCLSFCVRSSNFVSHILAGTEKGTVYFCDLETNRMQHKQEMGESIQSLHSFDFKIITQEKEGILKLWSVKKSSYQVDRTHKCAPGFGRSILVEEALFVPQENSCVDVIDLDNFEKIKKLSPERENLGSVMALEQVIIGNTTCIMAGYETGDVILWDMNTFQPCGHIKLQDQLTSLTFDSLTKTGVAGGASNFLQLFTINTSYEFAVKLELSITNKGCSIVKLRPDRKILVAGCWDSKIRLFSWKSLRILAVLAEHKESITDVKFSPLPVNYWKSNIMAASSSDGVISLWNVYN